LFRFPDRDGPITDDPSEAISVPLIECGSDDRDIGGISLKFATEFRDEFVAVVEASIPRENKAPVREVRLSFATRLGSGVEGPIEKRNGTVHMTGFAIGPLMFQRLTNIREKLAVNRPSVNVPNPCLHA